MPIERVPIVHKFGIISKTHQEHLRQQMLNDDDEETFSMKLQHQRDVTTVPTPYKSGYAAEVVEEIVHQLQNETEDLLIFELEETAQRIIQKIKFKLTSVAKKDGLNIVTSCWKDLCSLSQSKNSRIVGDSLNLLQQSLEVSPLSRHMVASLLDLGIVYLQSLVLLDNDDIVTKNYSNNELVVKTSFILFTRLYYHSKAGDISQDCRQLEALYLISKGLNETLSVYQENPIIWSYLGIIYSIIVHICSRVLTTFDKDPVSDTDGTDESKEKEKEVIVEITDKNIPNFLWNILQIWKSISRKIKLRKSIFEELCCIDLSKVNADTPHWMDYILGFFTLSECAKLETDFLRLYLRLGPKESKKSLLQVGEKNEPSSNSNPCWQLQLWVTYLRCLSDIAVCGLTSDVVTLALFGDEIHNGLVDYLDDIRINETSWMIQQTAYQCLYDVYMCHKKDQLRDCQTNMVWDVLLRFQEKQRDVRVLSINKFDGKNSLNPHDNSVFRKIATNFAIMFLPMETPHQRKCDTRKSTNERSPTQKRTTKEHASYDQVKSKVDTYQHHEYKTPHQHQTWSHMQGIITQQFSAWKEEDEREFEKAKEELEKLNLVFKPEYDGPLLLP